MPIQSSDVALNDAFEEDLGELRESYPDIDATIKDLIDTLKGGYQLPESPVDPDLSPRVYAQRIDYEALGADGRGRFIVTYHATAQKPSPVTPYQTIELLTIIERQPDSNSLMTGDAK